MLKDCCDLQKKLKLLVKLKVTKHVKMSKSLAEKKEGGMKNKLNNFAKANFKAIVFKGTEETIKGNIL